VGKVTSAVGRKVIPYLVVYLLGALTAVAVSEVRIWQHWQGEAAEQVAEEHAVALDMAARGQRQSRVVARALIASEGNPKSVPGRLPDGYVQLSPDGTKTILRHTP
jgi:hypothetical protein